MTAPTTTVWDHLVEEEQARQYAKWGLRDNAPDRWLTILVEELGEAFAERDRSGTMRDTCVRTVGNVARAILCRRSGELLVQLHTLYRQAEAAWRVGTVGGERIEWVQVGAVTRSWLEALTSGA